MQISNLQQSKTRSRYIVISTVFLLLFINTLSVFTTTSRVCAAERPSFNLDYSAWKATHIVLATENGTIDGRLKVVESWKGDIKPGMELILPELGASMPNNILRRVVLPVPFSPTSPIRSVGPMNSSQSVKRSFLPKYLCRR